MKNIDVSIIIPVYNVEDYVAECLQSVMAQTADCAMECIVVDDRGSDDSMAVVKRTIAEYNGPVEFRIITREVNGGLSAARNTGIRAARGRYVYFLDSDDYISADAMEKLMAFARKYPEAEIITGDFITEPYNSAVMTLSLQGKKFPQYSDNVRWIRSVYLTIFPVIACNKFISKEFILCHKLFFREGILHEDNHWQAMSYRYISKVAFVNEYTYHYRLREGSITTAPNANFRKLDNLAKIYAEMFNTHFKWDRFWVNWVLCSLNWLKFMDRSEYPDNNIEKTYRTLINILLANPAVSPLLKLLFRYHALPRPYMRVKFINMALNVIMPKRGFQSTYK